MAAEKVQQNITKIAIEKLLTCKDVEKFEKVAAEWTTSKHWTNFWAPKVDGCVIKSFGICKVCSMVLSVPAGATYTLNRHHESHGKKILQVDSANKQGQGCLGAFFQTKHVPDKVSELESARG